MNAAKVATSNAQREVPAIEKDLSYNTNLKNDLLTKTQGLKAAIIMHIPIVCIGDRLPEEKALKALANDNGFFKDYVDGQFKLSTGSTYFKCEDAISKDKWIVQIMNSYPDHVDLKKQHDRLVNEHATVSSKVILLKKELDATKYANEYALGHVLEDLFNEDRGIKEGNNKGDGSGAEVKRHNMGSVTGLDGIVEHIKTGKAPTPDMKW